MEQLAEGYSEEEEARVKTARDKVEEWQKNDSQIASLSGVELSLLRQMLTVPEEYRRQQIFLISEFMDQEEALDHVAAYYEALELGMDTGFNVAYMMALAATNRRENARSNRVAAILASLSSFRYTTNTPKDEKKRANSPERGPLSG